MEELEKKDPDFFDIKEKIKYVIGDFIVDNMEQRHFIDQSNNVKEILIGGTSAKYVPYSTRTESDSNVVRGRVLNARSLLSNNDPNAQDFIFVKTDDHRS